ncbi:hypothetical protein BDV95DRAFT_339447 [Massariosphaeria phaeospora]|uniref:Uncharacterized protein n=1 Tax=Massariosphaeria phaeospora TaxID=100035 RepID=A0A7C8I8J1_9PLEO|nr:hypothetical protein BDV95DRAFT_339447 [Massariosphaeria phaeospora]
MPFKNLMIRIRRVLLCFPEERKHSLEIGFSTDVRKMDVGETIPGLTEEEKRIIREKASTDAIRLVSLASHPPTQAPCSPPSTISTTAPSSREPSQTLLNSASSNLPALLPTPPRQKHSDASPPTYRVKSMWERTRRLSASLGSSPHHGHHAGGYQELEREEQEANPVVVENVAQVGEECGKEDEAIAMLNLDLSYDDKDGGLGFDVESPVSVSGSGKSVRGFEVQDVVGGDAYLPSPSHMQTVSPKPKARVVFANPVVRDVEGDSSASDSDAESAVAVAERSPLVAV